MKRRFSLLSLPFAAGTGGLLGLLPAASRAQEAATPEDKIDQLIGLLNDPEVQAVLKSHAATVPDGIAAEASENVEMVIVADLNLAAIRWARAQGSVRNLRDRRFDLYRTRWADGG